MFRLENTDKNIPGLRYVTYIPNRSVHPTDLTFSIEILNLHIWRDSSSNETENWIFKVGLCNHL